MKKYVPWLIGGTLLAIAIATAKTMLAPIKGRITSPFGERNNPVTGAKEFHNGIDIAGETGEVILSPADGYIYSQYSNLTGGNQMTVKHTNGFTSGYAHLSSYILKTGDQVKRGTAIAKVGSTGTVTGPHLHFTLRNANGDSVDPEKYIT